MLHLFLEIIRKIDRKTLILGVIETSLIVFLLARSIFSQHVTAPKTQDNESRLRDSIAVITKQFDALQADIVSLYRFDDSLASLKPTIQKRYEKRIQYEKSTSLDTVASFLHNELRTD